MGKGNGKRKSKQKRHKIHKKGDNVYFTGNPDEEIKLLDFEKNVPDCLVGTFKINGHVYCPMEFTVDGVKSCSECNHNKNYNRF